MQTTDRDAGEQKRHIQTAGGKKSAYKEECTYKQPVEGVGGKDSKTAGSPRSIPGNKGTKVKAKLKVLGRPGRDLVLKTLEIKQRAGAHI